MTLQEPSRVLEAVLGWPSRPTGGEDPLRGTFREFAKQAALPDAETMERIYFLDRAFEKEGCPTAARAFRTWMYGTTKDTLDADATHKGGTGQVPALILAADTFARTRVVTAVRALARDAARGVLEELQREASPKRTDFLNFARRAGVADLEVGASMAIPTLADGGWNGTRFALAHAACPLPWTLLSETELWRIGLELLLPGPAVFRMLSALTTACSLRIADVAATLGSFRIHAYPGGTFTRIDDAIIEARIDRLVFRTVDSYDFEGPQSLGFWFPFLATDKGHVLPPCRGVLPSQMLTNEHFTTFASTVAPALNAYLDAHRASAPRLACKEFHVVTRAQSELLEDVAVVRIV